MPQQHQVQAGDTVSAIAKRFNVRPEDVSGFRSNDPNVIFPGETLNIQQQTLAPEGTPQAPQQGQVVDGSALQPAQGQNVVDPTPELPASVEQTAQIQPAQPPVDAGAGAITETIKQSGEQAEAPTVAVTPETPISPIQDLADQTFEQAAASAESFFTPSGAEISPEGELVNPPEEQLDQALGQFGISGEAVGQGFQTNPFGTISDIVQQVMQMTGLPDTREQVTSTANEIEDLENERDRQIADIQDDPFSSVSSKRQRAQNVSDTFDKRINARVNKLTLLQSGQETARRQAQFAATTAINLFGQQQEFQADEVERILDREEKQLEAERGLGKEKLESQLLQERITSERLSQAKTKAQTAGIIADTSGISTEASGQFAGIIDAASNLVGAERGKTSRRAITKAVADGDYATAYAEVANNVEASLTGTVKTRFANSRNDIQVMAGMRNTIEQYAAEGGDMSLLRGKTEEIERKLGILAEDPKATAIAVQLQREFQTYRNIMTGAAFTPAESREYASVNPRSTASIELNLATIDGALNQLENRITGTVNARIPTASKLFDVVTGEAQLDLDPATAPVGTMLNMGGSVYRKIGEDEYELIQ